MKKSILTLIFVSTLITFGYAATLYQAGTINALMRGLYQGNITIKQAKKHGTMGLGCGVGLGELIACCGKYYLADGHGNITEMKNDQMTPFVDTVKFDPKITFNVNDIKNLNALKAAIDKKLPSKNIFYALKIKGDFNAILARSEDIAKPPYEPLLQWLSKHQHIFTEKNVQATVVAFKCPAFVKGIGVPGYHLHYITKDRTRGGHIFDINIKSAKVEIQPLYKFKLVLPRTKEFLTANISYGKKTQKHLKKIESKK